MNIFYICYVNNTTSEYIIIIIIISIITTLHLHYYVQFAANVLLKEKLSKIISTRTGYMFISLKNLIFIDFKFYM